MSEQQMPAKFRITWKDGRYFVSIPNYEGGEVVKADLAERMAEALGKLDVLLDFGDEELSDTWTFEDTSSIKEAFEEARSALSAFRSATQDTEASHD